MPWYAAHAILYVRFKSGGQTAYPVWENVLLIRARDPTSAWRKAVRRAKRDEGDGGGTFRWNNRPAEWVFAGLRKVVAVSHQGAARTPGDGDEITYSEFELADAASLRKLVAGRAVSAQYVE
jgi:hypothetical protein